MTIHDSAAVRNSARYFENLYRRYHRPEYLGYDPLVVVHRFEAAGDREIAALFGALLAYGQVSQILNSLSELFERMDGAPAEFVMQSSGGEWERRLRGFRHRVTGEAELLGVVELLRGTIEEFGSLERAFLAHDESESGDYAGALDGLLAHWERSKGSHWCQRLWARVSFRHLLSAPRRGSACKRWFLFLRWVVRPADGIDLGLWSHACPAKLVFPVDRHVLRIATHLGILPQSARPTLQVARRITEFFRRFDPDDPTRFDFALCHLGILDACPATPSLVACGPCELGPVCRLRQRLMGSSSLRADRFAQRAPRCAPKRRGR